MSALWLALHFPLLAEEADPPSREHALAREARHLLALTPKVCLAGSAASAASAKFTTSSTLLLEVGGCLKLFGGLAALLARLDRYRRHCPFTTRMGLGPTPLAAWHLTDLPTPETVPEPARFQAWLAALPLAKLDLDPNLRKRLQAPGFRTLGELFPLPRPALGKRFGAGFLDWLQRLLGEKPDPRSPIAPPRPFRERQEFDQSVADLGLLESPMATMLDSLERWLDLHQETITAIRWHLFLDHRHRDTLIVRRARPGHDATTWLDLSRRRLAHYEASAGVLALALDTSRPRPRNPALATLFPEPGARPPLSDLLEKLATEPTLSLYQPRVGDHLLPEYNDVTDSPLAPAATDASTSSSAFTDRPAWLLESPLRLRDRDNIPLWRGRLLALFPQEERFSQPWLGIAPRHYRIAHHPDGSCCWVFQDEQLQWWLQGLF